MKSIVHIITPIITEGIRSLDEVEPYLRPDLDIRHSLIDKGPASIECSADEALSVPGLMEMAVAAERDGANALVIDCMGDPGLAACREMVSIPVLGPGETCMHHASMLGHRFAFVTVLDRLRPLIDDLVAHYGLQHNYAGFAAIDIPVLELGTRLQEAVDLLALKSRESVVSQHAGAIILGCTGFFGCAEGIKTRLQESGIDVPVIDPIPLTLHIADALVKTGLSHSKHVYPPPRQKHLSGYKLPENYQIQ